ncbi:DUF4352 domain-containing protein [Plantactinospora sp. CA-290183]|uniref:DUF4352 domain-containing protein n=1 Tax=Plantactinospora sp. CA-290183 TaxID=3240006 RepID=UPI003D8C14E7
MSRPDQSGPDPHQPGAGPGGQRPENPPEPTARPWEWAVDPPPPEGPSQEPTADPAAGDSIDLAPEGAPEAMTELPTGSGPAPPDWSTPETPVSTPPLGGIPPPPPVPPGGPVDPDDPLTHGPGPVPQFARPADRRWWFILGIVAALLSGCCVAAVVVTLAWGPEIYTGLRDRGQRIVALGQPARDGDLEFRVGEVRCGLPEVGDALVSQLAVGQFCVVQLAVRNLGSRPVVLQEDLQVAYGPAGQHFGVDSGASLLANADQLAFLSEINPGNRVTGAIVYDIPPDSRIVRLRLRHTAGSAGVQVRTG